MAVHCADDRLRRAEAAAGRRTIGIAGLGAGAIVAARLLTPYDATHGPVVCPFRLATGLPCPGCGLTRSWVYWMHGDWKDGMIANPFGIVLLAAAVGFLAGVVSNAVRGRPLPDVDRLVMRRPVLMVVALWLGFALVRVGLVATGAASL